MLGGLMSLLSELPHASAHKIKRDGRSATQTSDAIAHSPGKQWEKIKMKRAERDCKRH